MLRHSHNYYTDEESHLCCEDELVAFEKTASRIDEDRVSDAVDQVDDSLFHFFRRFSTVDRLLEHHAECLQNRHAFNQ